MTVKYLNFQRIYTLHILYQNIHILLSSEDI